MHSRFSYYERNPRTLPLVLALRIRVCRILGPAPVKLQKLEITCECAEIALPRTLFRDLSPIMSRAATTAGVKGPNFACFPIVIPAAPVRLHEEGLVEEDFRNMPWAPDPVTKAAFIFSSGGKLIERGCKVEMMWEVYE